MLNLSGLLIFAAFYSVIGTLFIVVTYKKVKKHIVKNRRSKFILIQGGKKKRGPHGKSR